MKFEKFKINEFSKEKLLDNLIRSITGGHEFRTNCGGDVKDEDYIDNEGCTHFGDGGTNCDTDVCK